MPFGSPTASRTFAEPPPAGPLWDLRTDGSGVRLGIPGLGWMRVDHDSLEIQAPDEDRAHRIEARLLSWAVGQWLLARGIAVLRGAVVARDGVAVAIVGPSCSGASVTAAQLTRLGWGLVSDGIAAIDATGHAVAGPPLVRMDAFVAERLFADRPSTPVPAGRPRSDVAVNGHPSARVAAYVSLTARESARGVGIIPTSAGESAEESRRPDPTARVLPCIPGVEPVIEPTADSWLLSRGIPHRVEDLAEVGPAAVAAAIDRALGHLGGR